MKIFKKEFWSKDLPKGWNIVLWCMLGTLYISLAILGAQNNEWHEMGEFNDKGDFVINSGVTIVRTDNPYLAKFTLTVFYKDKETIVSIDSWGYDNSEDMLNDLNEEFVDAKKRLKKDPYFSLYK